MAFSAGLFAAGQLSAWRPRHVAGNPAQPAFLAAVRPFTVSRLWLGRAYEGDDEGIADLVGTDLRQAAGALLPAGLVLGGGEPIFGGQNSIARPCRKARTIKIVITVRIAPAT
jgi:hypothetical protein